MKTENSASKKEIERFREMAREAVAHHFGSRPSRIVFKASGLSNFVFAVKNSEGDFIVRISPEQWRIKSFFKEQWAQNAAHEAGVPTAEILEVGMETISQPYMIIRFVEGVEATRHPKRMEILCELGKYAALINSIKTKGFGKTFDWSSNQLSLNETWKDYLQKELKFEERLQFLEKQKMISEPQRKQLEKIFTEALKLKPKPALNHSDLRLKNVIVNEDGKIKAVIDWENCLSTIAPQWELSIALHDLWIDEKQVFLEGYGLTPKKITESAPLMKAFNIINYAPQVERFVEAKDAARLAQYRTRLSGTLDFYSL
jgi:aminoglycoside phosphotransferase (APT) family kinase protein